MEENRNDNSQKKVKSCAVCKHRRTKCNKDCPLAPYFPADNPQLFKTVHRCFGVTNMINALRSTPPDLRDDLMTSIIYSANARVIDPVRGCLGEIQTLLSKIMYARTELDCLRSLIQQFPNQNDQNQRFDNQHFENPQSIPTFHEPQLVNTQNRASDDVPLFADDYVVDEAVIVECPEQQFQNQHFENQQYMPSFHQPLNGNNQYSAIDNDPLPSYDYVTETDFFGRTNQDQYQNKQSTPSIFPQPQYGDTQHRVNNDDVPLSVDDYVVDEAVFVECPDQQFQNKHFENQQYMPSFHEAQLRNNQYSVIDNDPLPSYNYVTETDLFGGINQEFQNQQSMSLSFPQPPQPRNTH